MIGRVLLAALLAGVAAGLILAAIQHVRLTPLILAAEIFEKGAETHDHDQPSAPTAGEQTAAHSHDDAAEWAPQDGAQRTMFTTSASMVAGAGFAALLAGVSFLTGVPITRRNGVLWGISGFLAVTLAPAAGLPPELPGMPAADLVMRQAWWLATIALTGTAIYLIAIKQTPRALAAAIILIALPHLIGAPQPESHESAVPAGLSAAFAANSLAANAIFWILIGAFLGYALNRDVAREQRA